MRKFVLAAVVALATGALSTTGANAIPPAPEGLRPAIDSINPVDNVACWRRGWHGWGWYPCRRVIVPRYYGHYPHYRNYGYRWYRYPRVYRYGYGSWRGGPRWY